MNFIKISMICTIITLISGCVSTPAKTLDALIIINNTNKPVFDVKLRDTEKGGEFSCGYILPNNDCSVSFSAIENKDHKAIISWKQNGRTYKQILPKDKNPAIHPKYPNKAVVTILNGGRLTLSLD